MNKTKSIENLEHQLKCIFINEQKIEVIFVLYETLSQMIVGTICSINSNNYSKDQLENTKKGFIKLHDTYQKIFFEMIELFDEKIKEREEK